MAAVGEKAEAVLIQVAETMAAFTKIVQTFETKLGSGGEQSGGGGGDGGRMAKEIDGKA